MENTYQLTGNKTLRVIQDDSPSESPRDWDNLGVMVCFHNRYTLGDKHDIQPDDYSSFAEMRNGIEKTQDAAVILPVYMYDHSGITLSTKPFNDRWDSGQLGFIYVTKDKLRKEYGVKRLSQKILDKAKEVLISEVKVYDQYVTGDVWGFKVLDADGEELDSCWGFYGSDPKTNGMLEHINETLVETD